MYSSITCSKNKTKNIVIYSKNSTIIVTDLCTYLFHTVINRINCIINIETYNSLLITFELFWKNLPTTIVSAKPKRQAIRMFSRASSSKLMSVALFVIFLKELNFDVEAMETLQMLKQIPKFLLIER